MGWAAEPRREALECCKGRSWRRPRAIPGEVQLGGDQDRGWGMGGQGPLWDGGRPRPRIRVRAGALEKAVG